MADINPTQVTYGGASLIVTAGIAGESLTVEQAVYKSTADGKWYACDCDDTVRMANVTTTGTNKIGILMIGGGSTNDACAVATKGPVNLGAVLTAGTAYYASDTLGGICPAADTASGDVPVYLGTALTTSILDLAPVNHGTAI